MEENNKNKLVRVLGLKESISMTIGTVVGVGLFTCGSSQIGLVGSWIIAFTVLSLLISIWPCLIYGEMAAALPCAGGTYNYAKRGLNRIWANQSGWHYIIGCMSFLGLKIKYPEMNRPYLAPFGKFGFYFTILVYIFMLIFADKLALLTALVISILSFLYWLIFTRKKNQGMISVEEEIGIIEEPSVKEKNILDKEYRIWKMGTVIASLVALCIYLLPMLF